MEEEATDLPNSMKPEDLSLQNKHQAMLDRLSNRHQARSKSSTTSSSTDSTASFLSKFSESKHSIDSQISESSKLATTDPTLLKSHFVNISSSISSLEQLVAENSFLLPSYELRSALKTVSELRQSLENLNSELVPKKKFSFKNKSITKASPPDPKPAEVENPDTPKVVQTIRDSPGIRNKTNETLTKEFRGSDIGEFTLSDLDSCEVRLIGSVNSLFINRVRNCRVYSGPVIGSILIEEVENCVFVLASHQIRIHYAKGSDFYLRVRSRPIIEDCGGVRFAPYCLRYEGIEEDMREAGLGEETGNWSNVDDFKWLRAVQSPNWSVLENTERVGNIEIKDLGIRNSIN
ncbi:tubulin-folding cofactor C [Euphorbia lathyris]|uniref:tubulin-folding cofactor C n=1 Tax=Euphorbia lathyris TaxID=212925 RepID=UPI003313A9CA